MELDKRIVPGKRPLTCFDVEEAKKYIGKKGYFSNSLGWYSVLKRTWNGTLDDIVSQKEQCFYDCESEGYFHYFLPAEWIKSEEPKKKYRPYSIKDFRKAFVNEKLDVFIILRDKHNPDDIYTLRYNGCVRKGQFEYIYLGDKIFSFKSLFENYEVADYDGNWQPFGVKEIPEV